MTTYGPELTLLVPCCDGGSSTVEVSLTGRILLLGPVLQFTGTVCWMGVLFELPHIYPLNFCELYVVSIIIDVRYITSFSCGRRKTSLALF